MIDVIFNSFKVKIYLLIIIKKYKKKKLKKKKVIEKSCKQKIYL